MPDQFSRTRMLLGDEAMLKLFSARAAVFGVGGVGGYAAEALVRSGIGAIDLVDSDKVSITNLNRQIIAAHDTVGKFKTDAMEERILKINPHCKVTKHNIFYTPETADNFDLTQYDYVVDAIDTVSGKIELILQSQKCGTPVISSMGAGNKLDPTAFEVADIYSTSVCPLARVMRHELKKRGVKSLKVVYSKEKPIVPPGISDEEAAGKKVIPASIAFVPSVAGLIIAGEVIKDICGIKK